MTKRLVCAVLAALAVAAGCSSEEEGLDTTLDEYSIRLGDHRVEAGSKTFRASNDGAIAHQLIVLRTKRPAGRLPVDDGVVDTGAKGIDVAGELELVPAGASEALQVRLRPGSYVLICNIAGHYTSGMHTSLGVR
jgi:uncharacterized cupredoxin-like copper-binding protein